MQKAGYNIERAESELATSRLQWAPDLSLSVSASYLGNETLTDRDFSNSETIDMPHFSNKLSLRLTQTLYDGSMLAEIKQQEQILKQIEAQIRLADLERKTVALHHQGIPVRVKEFQYRVSWIIVRATGCQKKAASL